MRRFALAVAILAVTVSACADRSPVASGDPSASPTPTAQVSDRVLAYEALFRHLADPKGPSPIYVGTELCFMLMGIDEDAHGTECPEAITADEQQQLQERVRDLPRIEFVVDGDWSVLPDEPWQAIFFSPIVEKPDGLRVEGASTCGGLCGSGSVYILVPSEDGFEVQGTDESYGTWIS